MPTSDSSQWIRDLSRSITSPTCGVAKVTSNSKLFGASGRAGIGPPGEALRSCSALLEHEQPGKGFVMTTYRRRAVEPSSVRL